MALQSDLHMTFLLLIPFYFSYEPLWSDLLCLVSHLPPLPFHLFPPPPPSRFHSPGWVCARSWCRRPWRSGRWQRAMRPPLQTRGRRRWSGDSWGCLPRTAEEGCAGKRAKKQSIIEVVIIIIAAEWEKNLINHDASMNLFESGRHFMCESNCLRRYWVLYMIITEMERSLSCLSHHLISLFHTIPTSLRIIPELLFKRKLNKKDKKVPGRLFLLIKDARHPLACLSNQQW